MLPDITVNLHLLRRLRDSCVDGMSVVLLGGEYEGEKSGISRNSG